MNTESPVYSPGDTAGILRYPARNFVPSSWNPVPLLGSNGSSMAIAAGVALAIIFFLSRGK
jgi:hypothetical protein